MSPTLLALVGLNVAVFVLWNTWGRTEAGYDFLSAHFLVSSESIASLRVWTLLTSEISHIDVMHLLYNMLALWVFGRDVERVIGSGRFVALYVAGALAASLAHVAWDFAMAAPIPALGASGAVMGIAVLFGALFPKRTLYVQFFLPLPAAVAVGLFVLLDVAGAIGGTGNVAHAAHLGGAAVGLFAWLLLRGRIRRV